MKKLAGILLTAIFVISVPVLAMAADVSAKVNIVLDDGTIMLYSGSKAGISVGDEFEVKRNEKVVGHIKAKEVQQFVTYATLQDGAVEEMDMAHRTKQGSATKEDKMANSSKPAKEEKQSSSSKERASSKKSGEDDDDSKSSTRRDRAKERGSDTKDDSKTDKKEDKKEEKKTERRPLPPAQPIEKKTDWKKPLGSIGAGGYGLTGLIYTPTADVIRKGDGSVHFNYVDAENEKRLMFKDLGFGITYGIDDDIEIAYTFLNTDYAIPQSFSFLDINTDTHIFSFKYQTNYFKAPAFLTSNVTESRLALGLRYFDASTSVSLAGVDLCGNSCSSDATRVFAVMTGKYSMGAGHLGIYYQTGDMVDDTYYDGFGFFAGAEYIVGGKDNSFINRLSVLGEYDHKAFYLGTARTPSIGLRYYFQESSHITINMLDVTDTAVMNIEGAYGF